jgi:hypothetical protein
MIGHSDQLDHRSGGHLPHDARDGSALLRLITATRSGQLSPRTGAKQLFGGSGAWSNRARWIRNPARR